MNNLYKKAFKINVHFSILIAIGFILLSVIYYFKGASIIINPNILNINYIICLCGLVISIKKTQKEVFKNMTFSNIFFTCLFTCSVSALIYAIYAFFITKYDPNIITQTISILKHSLEDLNYPDKEVSTLIKLYKAISSPITIAISQFISKTLMGLFFSLILGLIYNRRRI